MRKNTIWWIFFGGWGISDQKFITPKKNADIFELQLGSEISFKLITKSLLLELDSKNHETESQYGEAIWSGILCPLQHEKIYDFRWETFYFITKIVG